MKTFKNILLSILIVAIALFAIVVVSVVYIITVEFVSKLIAVDELYISGLIVLVWMYILVYSIVSNRDQINHKDLCDCEDYDKGLVSNYCPVHNENPLSDNE